MINLLPKQELNYKLLRMTGGATCIDNASDTSSTALSRIFHLIKTVNL
jgi:hypothetical protein